jgi:hypothetical protein
MAEKFESSGPIFNDLAEFFVGDEWSPEQVERQPVLRMDFEGDNGKWSCLAFAHDDRERVVFYSLLPLQVPEEKRAAVAEFITRANFGMEIGNFEMDYSDGTLQFRTSLDIEGGELTPMMIQNLAYTNVAITNQYLPGVVMVVEGDAPPPRRLKKWKTRSRPKKLPRKRKRPESLANNRTRFFTVYREKPRVFLFPCCFWTPQLNGGSLAGRYIGRR